MTRSLRDKSTLSEIRRRFDADVERFARLETGQQATMDAALVLDLVSQTAAATVPSGGALLDLGCGAGNFTLKVLERSHPLECTLVDLSAAMLARARERVAATDLARTLVTHQQDMRTLDFQEGRFDVILAGAVLHHLREDADWRAMFDRLHRWLKPGGMLFVWDLADFDNPGLRDVMWRRYGDYLTGLGGEVHRDKVFAYIDAEDSPRSLRFQLDLARDVGFADRDVLHRTAVFAAWFARK